MTTPPSSSTEPVPPPDPARGRTVLAKCGIALAVLAALAVPGYFGGVAIINHCLAGDDLRQRLSRQLATALDARAGVLPLKWQGVAAFSEGALVQGEASRALTEVRARKLTARCVPSALWHRQVRIEQLTIAHLQAAFGRPAATLLRDPLQPAPELLPKTEETSSLTTDIREVVIDRTDLIWGSEGEGGGHLLEVTSKYWPDGKNLKCEGYGGVFRQGALPEAKVSAFQIYYAKPRLRLDSGLLTLGATGRVGVTGFFEFTNPGQMELHLDFQRCAAEPFLPKDLQNKFEGTFASQTTITKELGAEAEPELQGSISAPGSTITNVPALKKLAAFTKEKGFQRLQLRELKGNYTWKKPRLEIRDLEAESPELLRVEGDLTINGKALAGALQLGVSEKVLESFPGAREEVFTKHRGDYYWATVKLSGTTDDPQQNLQERLVEAAKKHFAKKLLAPVLKPGEEIIKAIRGLF